MKSLPKVTIIVPIYKVETFIERSARSVLGQTYDNLELLFIDDCSPDNSISVLLGLLQEYPNRKSQVRIIRNEKNLGISAVRNLAIENSNGDFVSFVDADDWVEFNLVEVLVKKQLESNADIVSSNTFCHNKNGDISVGDTYSSLQGDSLKNIIMHKAAFNLWGRLIRLSLYRVNGIQCKDGVNQGEDLQTFPKLAFYAQKHVCVNIPLYHYNNDNVNSYSHTYKLSDIKQMYISFDIFYVFFIQNAAKYYDSLQKRKMDFLFFLMRLSAQVCNRDLFDEYKTELLKLEKENVKLVYKDFKHRIRKIYEVNRLYSFLNK